MSMLKRIGEETQLTSMYFPITSESSFKGILLRWSSSAQGATAVTPYDLGRLQYVKNGRTIIDAGINFLMVYGELFGGFSNRESTASGALDMACYIPRSWFGDNNVEYVVPQDNASLRITSGSSLDTNAGATGKLEVYLDIEQGVSKYDLTINQFSDSLAGAGTRPLSFDIQNICAVLLSATVSSVLTLTSSNITSCSYQVGPMSGDASIEALQAFTPFNNNLNGLNILACASSLTTTSGATLIATGAPYLFAAKLFTADGDISSMMADNVSMSLITSGACTPEILIAGLSFNFDRMVATKTVSAANVNNAIGSKVRSGDYNTAKVIGTKTSAVASKS